MKDKSNFPAGLVRSCEPVCCESILGGPCQAFWLSQVGPARRIKGAKVDSTFQRLLVRSCKNCFVHGQTAVGRGFLSVVLSEAAMEARVDNISSELLPAQSEAWRQGQQSPASSVCCPPGCFEPAQGCCLGPGQDLKEKKRFQFSSRPLSFVL